MKVTYNAQWAVTAINTQMFTGCTDTVSAGLGLTLNQTRNDLL